MSGRRFGGRSLDRSGRSLDRGGRSLDRGGRSLDRGGRSLDRGGRSPARGARSRSGGRSPQIPMPDIPLALRPGYGTEGTPYRVKANHLAVSISKRKFYHYAVKFQPKQTKVIRRRAAIKQLHLGAYDGSENLYTAYPLPYDFKRFEVNLADGGSTKVFINFVSTKEFSPDAPDDAAIHILGIALRETPSANSTRIRRSYFMRGGLEQPKPLGNGLAYCIGYYQSLRSTQMGMSLNIDASGATFYEPLNVIDFVTQFLNLQNPSEPLSLTNRDKVLKVLRGVKVELCHVNRRTIVITGITFKPTSVLTFVDDRNNTKSVVEYFKDKYEIELKYVNWPSLVAVIGQRLIFLPMEVCEIAKGQSYCSQLNEKQMSAISASFQCPSEKEKYLCETVGLNNYGEDKYAMEFGIGVEDRLTSIDARLLAPPMLKYRDSTGSAFKSVIPQISQWNMDDVRFVKGGIVERWGCVSFSKIPTEVANSFFQKLVDMCVLKGMTFKPTMFKKNASSNLIEKTLVDIHAESSGKLQLLIIILPEVTGSYGTIKRICETKLGIMSQCCRPEKAEKLDAKYMASLSLKINVKVGGQNSVLVDLPCILDSATVIFGADVTHPQPGETFPSIAAVVASMGCPEITSYKCLVSAQEPGKELIDNLFKITEDPQKGKLYGGMISELLSSFFESTGRKPKSVIFYRDGVGESQFSQVLQHEVDAIRKAGSSLGYKLEITCVIVQKRHHTRLFPSSHNDSTMMDMSGNILPGTVVDQKICHPTQFDFYLCSHAGIQGTSRPAHYNVILNESNFTSDDLQKLTNDLCYTNPRCTQSVSIVSPAYYAHLGASRARYYIDGYGEPSTTGGGDRNTGKGTAAVQPLPEIKGGVKEFMFYC